MEENLVPRDKENFIFNSATQIHNKQQIINKIITRTKNLTDNEKRHILNILLIYEREKKVEFTKNSNGYFFYLYKIDIEIINKILKCIELIEEKREVIYNLDKKRNEHIDYYKSLIENKLKETINLKKFTLINTLRIIPNDFYTIKKKETNIRKVKFNVDNLDPDILMKEHMKKKKYPKNSVYYRISQVMIQLSRQNKKSQSKNKNKNRDSGDAREDNDGSDGGGIGDDIGDDIGDEIEGEDEIEDEISGDDDKDDNRSINLDNDISELEDDEYYNSEDEKLSDHDHDHDNETETHTETQTETHRLKKKKTKISSNELDYYKNLLKQGGYKFDDDKEVIMIKEEYIL